MQPDLPPVDYLLIHYENLPDLQSLHHETVHIHAGKSHPAARLESRILSQVRSPLEQGGYVSAPCQDRGDDLYQQVLQETGQKTLFKAQKTRGIQEALLLRFQSAKKLLSTIPKSSLLIKTINVQPDILSMASTIHLI